MLLRPPPRRTPLARSLRDRGPGVDGAALVALLALLAFSVGQLASYWHLAAVRHARCADHGELVHVASSALRTHAATMDGAGTSAATHAAWGDAATEGGHGHEHCALGPHRRHEVAASAPVTSIARLAPVASPKLVAVAAVRPQAPPLTLAPKTSPPA